MRFWDFNCIKSMMTGKEGESYETNFDIASHEKMADGMKDTLNFISGGYRKRSHCQLMWTIVR